MIFYDCATAPSPRRARIILAEKQVPHEVVAVDLMSAEQLGEAYRKINSSATVPALQLGDGTVLTDNAGIAAFLEAEYPDPPLLGRTSAEKGLVATWVSKIEFEGLMAIAEAFRNASPAMKNRALTGVNNYAQIPELAERGLQRLHAFIDRLDQHLEGKEFIVNDHFSLADITAVVAVDFARIVKVIPSEEHSNLVRWRKGLAERPSINL